MALSIRRARDYIEGFLKIRTKDGQLVPFRMNTPQKKLYEAARRQAEAGKPVRIIVLKARQMGFSTLTEGMIFKDTATQPNISSGIVAHEAAATVSNPRSNQASISATINPAMAPGRLAVDENIAGTVMTASTA